MLSLREKLLGSTRDQIREQMHLVHIGAQRTPSTITHVYRDRWFGILKYRELGVYSQREKVRYRFQGDPRRYTGAQILDRLEAIRDTAPRRFDPAHLEEESVHGC